MGFQLTLRSLAPHSLYLLSLCGCFVMWLCLTKMALKDNLGNLLLLHTFTHTHAAAAQGRKCALTQHDDHALIFPQVCFRRESCYVVGFTRLILKIHRVDLAYGYGTRAEGCGILSHVRRFHSVVCLGKVSTGLLVESSLQR